MTKTYKVVFKTHNLGIYGVLIPNLEMAMQNELVRVYNIYAEKTNAGITDVLNKEFEQLCETTEYNKFMAEGYQRLIGDEFFKNASPLLDFYVDPDEVVLKGCLKYDHDITIEFYLKGA